MRRFSFWPLGNPEWFGGSRPLEEFAGAHGGGPKGQTSSTISRARAAGRAVVWRRHGYRKQQKPSKPGRSEIHFPGSWFQPVRRPALRDVRWGRHPRPRAPLKANPTRQRPISSGGLAALPKEPQ
jgi:hypothetical protein